MALTTTRADVIAFYEKVYTPKKVMSLALKDAPLTAYMPKATDGSGENVTVRLLDTESGGQGTTLAQAIANEKDLGAKKVILDWKKFYTSASIDNDSIETSKANAVGDMLRLNIESSLRFHGDQLETLLWGTDSGHIGQIATGGITGDVVTLTNASDCFKFEPGDEIIFDDTITGASPRTGSAIVESVQHEAGTVTFVDLSTVTSEAAGDYLFKKTFIGTDLPFGIGNWIPSTAPTGGDAFGAGSLDRSVNPIRLAGWRYTVVAGQSNRAAIIKALAFGKNFGGRPETVFMNSTRLAEFVLELQNQVTYDPLENKDLKISFRGVLLEGPQGPIRVVGSPKCPYKRAWALERDSWKIRSVGELVRNPLHNGKVIDAESEDGVRFRHKSYFVTECYAPGHNGCIVWP